jgi:hypothetical protein
MDSFDIQAMLLTLSSWVGDCVPLSLLRTGDQGTDFASLITLKSYQLFNFT